MHVPIQHTLSLDSLMLDTVFDAGETKTVGTKLALEWLEAPRESRRADMRMWSGRSAKVERTRTRRTSVREGVEGGGDRRHMAAFHAWGQLKRNINPNILLL